VLGWLDANLVSLLNGLTLGLLLFTLAVGLSLVFGMMDVLNLAHGSLFAVGAYVAWRLTEEMGAGAGFAAAIAVAALIGLVGGGALAAMTAPLARRGHLDQALLTLGVALVVADLMSAAFGDDPLSVPAPPVLEGSTSVLGHAYPTYRLALIGAGALLAVGLHLLVERTRLGALVRATVVDRDMVSALGVDTRKVLYGVFALGAALAAVAGTLGAPVLGAAPGLDEEVLILALVVIVVGGLGSVRGALLGALLIGQVQALGVALLPEYASFLLFGAMAIVLVVRPGGLLGGTARTA
jgi:branched-subunit amino acid ABC-type transport system permease component